MPHHTAEDTDRGRFSDAAAKGSDDDRERRSARFAAG
ncbi:MAG: hypothetical protein JWM42_3473 [Burkholderia sp.]|nr:hypothetical protein [Burkholderia sp.]